MRVIVSAGGTGGHIYPALAIIKKIKEVEPDSEFLYIGTHNRMENEIIPKHNIPFKTIEIYGFSKNILNNFKAIKKFYVAYKKSKEMIEDFKPDVVHIHELHAYFVNIKQLLDYLAEKKIKIVHTLHCEFSYTGKCGHSVECEKWKKECGECPHLRDYPTTLWFDHTKRMKKEKQDYFNKIDNLIIVTPSQWLAERTRMSFFKDRRIEVIHNGVDTNIFKPVDSSELKKERSI